MPVPLRVRTVARLFTPVIVSTLVVSSAVLIWSFAVWMSRAPTETKLWYSPPVCQVEVGPNDARPQCPISRVLGTCERLVTRSLVGTEACPTGDLSRVQPEAVAFQVPKHFFEPDLTYGLVAFVPHTAALRELGVTLKDTHTQKELFKIDSSKPQATGGAESDATASAVEAADSGGGNQNTRGGNTRGGNMIRASSGRAGPGGDGSDQLHKLDMVSDPRDPFGLFALQQSLYPPQSANPAAGAGSAAPVGGVPPTTATVGGGGRPGAAAADGGSSTGGQTLRRLLKGGGGGGGGGGFTRYRSTSTYSYRSRSYHGYGGGYSYSRRMFRRTRWGRTHWGDVEATFDDPVVAQIVTPSTPAVRRSSLSSWFGTSPSSQCAVATEGCDFRVRAPLARVGFESVTSFRLSEREVKSGDYLTLTVDKAVLDAQTSGEAALVSGGAAGFPMLFFTFQTEDTPYGYSLAWNVLPVSAVVVVAALVSLGCCTSHVAHRGGDLKSPAGAAGCICSRRYVLTMDVSSNDITSLDGLRRFPNLTELNVADNDIIHVEGIGPTEARNLESLNLASNNIVRFAPSSITDSLKRINLYNNDMKQLVNVDRSGRAERLSAAPGVQVLNLAHNDLTTLAGLERFPGLVELNASENDITDVSVLSRLPRLEVINLEQNNLASGADVVALANLPRLRVLRLRGNDFPAVEKQRMRDHFARFPAIDFTC